MKKRSALSKVEFDVFTIYADFNLCGRFTQLYHYTNADAKQKIVDGKKLDFQLTKTDAFLDKNEGTSMAVLGAHSVPCRILREKTWESDNKRE